ncbi:MAG: RAMP superfamily CRISPR-associated protein [Chloroflexota bacterium]
MKSVSLTITLNEPLLAPALNGDPNSAVSYPFIPGNLIRGAVAAQLVKPGDDLVITKRDLLFNGKTRFLHAYPEGADNQRSLPVPLSWRREKEEHPFKRVFDLSNGGTPKQGRKVSQPFYTTKTKETIHLHDPEKYFNVHTHREDRVMGRATEGSGAVFRYEAIAAGQTFVGAILFDDDMSIGDLLKDTSLRLGGSRSTGYGRVEITLGTEEANWREIGGNLDTISDIPAETPFVVTLLSDLLMQNKQGHYVTYLTENDFARWFGLSSAQEINIEEAYTAESIVGGYNQKWGLPLVQTPVLQAGTLFVLKATVPIEEEAIRNLEEKGVGKRRTEGFGRVAIIQKPADNPMGTVVYRDKEIDNQDTSNETLTPVVFSDRNSQSLAETMYKRLLLARLDDALASFINDKRKLNLSTQGITSTQLSRLRVKIRGYLINGQEAPSQGSALKEIDQWLGNLRRSGRKQYEQARVNNEPLLTWLKKRLDQPDKVWNLLENNPQSIPLARIESINVNELSGQMAIEATLRLIDGVLAKMAKEAKDQ